MKCKLFLTFDHELPLGGVKTSYKEALFEPTDKLLKTARTLGVPINLFTDILCAYRFIVWDRGIFFDLYQDQLRRTLKENHDVQLHIHPHWLTSSYDGTGFMPSTDFRLSDFAAHPDWPINKIIEQATGFLRDICSEAQPGYKCVAYRAGGYDLQRDNCEIIQSLVDNGICFDSTICKNYRFSSALSEVNHAGMPATPNWFIESTYNNNNETHDGILEIPIAGIPKSIFEIPTRFKIKKYAFRAPADHGFQIHKGRPAALSKRIIQLLSNRMLSFDNYTYSANYLLKILDYNLKKYRHYDEILLCSIGHPKTMGAYSVQLFSDFVSQVRNRYADQVTFYTYRRLYDELKVK